MSPGHVLKKYHFWTFLGQNIFVDDFKAHRSVKLLYGNEKYSKSLHKNTYFVLDSQNCYLVPFVPWTCLTKSGP